MDESLVDVDREVRFRIPVANRGQAKVYLGKGKVLGMLEQVEGMLSVKEYLKQTRSSEEQGDNDKSRVATVCNRDTFHLEVTDLDEWHHLLLEKLCFNDKCNSKERKAVLELCCKYSDTFAITELELGHCNFMDRDRRCTTIRQTAEMDAFPEASHG